jgi:hypothetical protein
LEYQCHFKAIGNIKKEEENIGKSKLLNAIMSSHRCLLKKKGKLKPRMNMSSLRKSMVVMYTK